MYGYRRSFLGGFDLPLFLAAILASLLGLAMISSAVKGSPDLSGTTRSQAIWLVAGLIMAMVAASLDYRLLVGSGLVLYGVGLATLLVVIIIGTILHGSRRWLNLGGQSFQPSEYMKVILLIMLAQYLGSRIENGWRFRDLVISAFILAVPALLVYSQPDLGTALVFVAIWGVVVFVAGVSFKEIAVVAVIVAIASPLIWMNLEDYMKDRVLARLNPGSNPDQDYIVQQALISIGSGSIWGKGYTAGSQSQLHFLRVRHTDFIFSVIGEELGFVGTVITIILLAFICYRLFSIGLTAPDGAGRILGCGAGALIAFQSIVNIGMNVGWLPVTGLPLPFLSQGGSALTTQMLAIGIAESVALRRM